jgi:hypothetical protein
MVTQHDLMHFLKFLKLESQAKKIERLIKGFPFSRKCSSAKKFVKVGALGGLSAFGFLLQVTIVTTKIMHFL